MSNFEANERAHREEMIEAIKAERERCMRIVNTAQPDYSGSGPVQFLNAGDYMDLLRVAINKTIAKDPIVVEEFRHE